MKVYLVGGAVRNEIMGIPAKDNDYVVVGATEQEMIDLGYSKVGADFPVFLHPETGEEYALARRERSTGPGYNDFEVEFSPDVTIEEDLYRRDFTMNAIAKDIETGEIVDPFDGKKHIKQRKIVVANPKAFIEDPVRILRMARFVAQYPVFSVSGQTIEYAWQGTIANATVERIYSELMKALMGAKPSKFFETLKHMPATYYWFKEVYDLIGVPQPIKWHAEGDAYTHTMMVLDSAAKHNEPLEVRLGCLLHDVGKATTKDTWPSHPAHEIRGVPLAEAFCERLKISTQLKKSAIFATKYHGHVHKAHDLKSKTYVKVYEDIKSAPNQFARVIAQVAWHDNEGKLPYENYRDNGSFFEEQIEALCWVKLSNRYTQEEIDAMSIDNRKNKLHQMRLEAVL